MLYVVCCMLSYLIFCLRCFYTPIGIWRSRINKEIKRKGEGQSSTQSVRQLEASFSNFLQEAITLFEYLITQYKSKLMPMALSQSQSQSQQSSSQLTQQTTQSQADLTQDSTTSTEGVVMGLYRLFVYLGDLYRYNKSFDLAEEAYLSANKLAPGLGQVRSPLLLSSEQKKNIENPMYNILEGPSSFLYRPSHSHVLSHLNYSLLSCTL